MSKISQASRPVAIGTPLGDDVLLLRSFVGREELGRSFEYELELLSEDPNINFDDIVGQNVTVRLQQKDGQTRYFNGFVSRFAHLPEMLQPGTLSRYRATMVPWLWFLTRASDCRIFQEMTVPDIIEQLFRDHGFSDFEVALTEDYRTWEYCVQYRETDFNFIHRLMEQEGIYYFFKHENGTHTMVLADSISAHEAIPGYEEVPYHGPSQQPLDKETISKWVIQQEIETGAYAINDFDFKAPAKSLLAKSQVLREHAASQYEMYDYPGEYTETSSGEHYAKVRIQELQAKNEVLSAASDARGLTCGCLFNLTAPPRDDQEGEYLITAARYRIHSDQFGSGGADEAPLFAMAFDAINSEESFRLASITPKPIVHGPQTAIVVGESGQEICTNEYGAIKVQFHWDRYGKVDKNSSCWIRVAQRWTGKHWGSQFIPRVGQEVVVDFLEGDPDHPLVTGEVYNQSCMPPYDPKTHPTITTLKSNSSKGGGGFNELRFEDKKGEEQVFLHAEKNLDNRVKNDFYEWVGHNRHLIVKTDQIEHVENSRHETVDGDHIEEIGGDRHLKVEGKEAKEVGAAQSLTVKGDVIEVFKGNHSEQTSLAYYLKANNVVVEATLGLTLKCGDNHVVIDPLGVTVKGSLVTIDGKMTQINSVPGSPAGSGQAGSAVAPTSPDEPEEADIADPGEMAEIIAEQRQTQSGKYGATPVTPYKPPQTEEEQEKKTSWIEIDLVDEDDQPVPGEKYKITLPDGETVAQGTLDHKGFARVEGIEPGTCEVTFPNLDKEAWEKL